MSFSDNVWDRSGSDELGKNVYAFMVCFWTAVGIGVSGVAARISYNLPVGWLLVIGVLVVSIAGVWIALSSDDPFISLIGYLMVTASLGVLTGPYAAEYTDASVVRVFFMTTTIVVVLGIIGAIIPVSLESWGSWLFGALTLLLVALIAQPIAQYFGANVEWTLTWLDWIGIIIFSGYVIYDLNRAMDIPYTQDNAIDSAVSVYLDFINIFIRLLSLYGDSKSD